VPRRGGEKRAQNEEHGSGPTHWIKSKQTEEKTKEREKQLVGKKEPALIAFKLKKGLEHRHGEGQIYSQSIGRRLVAQWSKGNKRSQDFVAEREKTRTPGQ